MKRKKRKSGKDIEEVLVNLIDFEKIKTIAKKSKKQVIPVAVQNNSTNEVIMSLMLTVEA